MKRDDVLKRLLDESEQEMIRWRLSRGLKDGQGPVTALFRTVAPESVSQEYDNCMAYLRFLRDWRDMERETDLMLQDSRYFVLMSPEWRGDVMAASQAEDFDYVLVTKQLVNETQRLAEVMQGQLQQMIDVHHMMDEHERHAMIAEQMHQTGLNAHQEMFDRGPAPGTSVGA